MQFRCAVVPMTLLLLADATVAPAAVYSVDSNADSPDADPFDGVCRSFDGGCTLRAAIEQANRNAGLDHIFLYADSYLLELPGPPDEDVTAYGDLDITGDVNIIGSGSSVVEVAGTCDCHRILHILNGARVELSGATVRGGVAPVGATGGGILVEEGELTLTEVRVTDNHSGGGGGIGVAAAAALTMDDCVVDFNVVTDDLAQRPRGAGISVAGVATIARSTIAFNELGAGTEPAHGAGLAVDGVATVVHSTLHGNRIAPGGLGAGLSTYGQAALTNSTVSGNGVLSGGPAIGEVFGGGLWQDAAAGLELELCTIAFNEADHGGGIFAGGRARVDQSIIGANSAIVSGNDCVTAAGGNLLSVGNNLIEDVSGCSELGDLSSNVYAPPLLDALAANGGATMTHALLGASPAIDAGPATCNALDQRDVARPLGAACDIGAFEFETCIDTVPSDQGNVIRAVRTGADVDLELAAAPAPRRRLHRDIGKLELGITDLVSDTTDDVLVDVGAVGAADDYYYYVRGLSACTATPGP